MARRMEEALNFRIALAGFCFALHVGAARADDAAHPRFTAIMDSTFGQGNWRMTGGYRTPERENELRAQGALTVPVGRLSRHSMGRPGAPGAYDVVVNGLSPAQAAAKLRRSGAPFRSMFAKGTHGSQGPHLHLEPAWIDFRSAGHPTPALQGLYFISDPSPAELALATLHSDALEGGADAQLRLGQVYAQAGVAAQDLVAAYVWTASAASNSASEASVRQTATQALTVLSRRMTAEQVADARRFVRPPVEVSGPAQCEMGRGPIGIVLLIAPPKTDPGDACPN